MEIISFASVFLGNLLWRKQRFQISQGLLPTSYISYGVKTYIFGVLSIAGIIGLILSLGFWKGLLAILAAFVLSGLIQK